MSLDLTDVDTFPAQITVPTSGDPKTSTGFLRAAFQGLANRTRNLYNKIGAASGIATLDAGSKVEQLSFGVTTVAENGTDGYIGGVVVGAAASWLDVPGASLTFTAVALDKISVDANISFQASGGGVAEARILITHTGGDNSAQNSNGTLQTNGTAIFPCLRAFLTGLGAGTVTVKLQTKASTNDTNVGNFGLHAVLVRT